MKIINLTPHNVRLLSKEVSDTGTLPGGNGYWFIDFPSEGVARVQEDSKIVDSIYTNMIDDAPIPHNAWVGVDIWSTSFGEVEDLPNPQHDTIFIVSRIVKQAVPTRDDCVVPHDVVRDLDGNIIGCRSFSR